MQSHGAQHGHSASRLLRFLLNADSYPHKPKHVRMEQTHASCVFIAPPFVFKVKKPVDFGFLDFSTLEKRRFYCEREVELNRRLCPSIYLGVIPIWSKGGRFSFEEGGRTVEYAVKMRHLSERYFLNRRIARHKLTFPDLDRVAAALGRFYVSQTPTVEIEAWGRIEKLRISTDENFRQMREHVGHTLSHAAWEAIRTYTERFYSRNASLFKSRIREGWIRDCHGDLHLDHIHLAPRSLHIYDCIEFNDRLRYVDVANDIAFLAMDLDYAGRPDLGRHIVEKMAAALGDSGLLKLVDFYKCYRACVRGKVASMRSEEAEMPDAKRKAGAESALRHFRLALQYALSGSMPMALGVMGRIASGKSVLARALSDELGWEVFSSDSLRKELAGVPLHERGNTAARVKLYSVAMTRKTYASLAGNALRRLNAGHSVILDATFARRTHRSRLLKSLGKVDANVCFIELQISDLVAMRRLKKREHSTDEISDARWEDFQMLNRNYEAPRELPAQRLLKIRAGKDVQSTLTATLKGLARLHGKRAS